MHNHIYLLIFLFSNVASDNSPKFCLCALKSVLKDYALLATERNPPRYYPSDENDIGFYVSPPNWKPVNDATWSELGHMINAPNGMYTQISIDGINPVYNGLPLDNRRSAYLADVMTDYRSLMYSVDVYHENIIKNRTATCSEETKAFGSGVQNSWAKYFEGSSNKN